MWFRFVSRPVKATRNTCTTMNATKKTITGKCTLRATSMGNALFSPLASVGNHEDMRQPVRAASGAATNTTSA